MYSLQMLSVGVWEWDMLFSLSKYVCGLVLQTSVLMITSISICVVRHVHFYDNTFHVRLKLDSKNIIKSILKEEAFSVSILFTMVSSAGRNPHKTTWLKGNEHTDGLGFKFLRSLFSMWCLQRVAKHILFRVRWGFNVKLNS